MLILIDVYGLIRAICCLHLLIMQQTVDLIQDKQITRNSLVG
jgi:hypothetical protein